MPGFETLRRALIEEAANNDFFGLWPRVMAARAALLTAFDAIDEAAGDVRPGTGEGEAAWSAREAGLHILAYTSNVTAIIEATARGETVTKDPMGTLSPDDTATMRELSRRLVAVSVRLATLHERLPATPNLETTVPHAVFGPLNARAWYAFLRLHDADHTAQIKRLAVPPA